MISEEIQQYVEELSNLSEISQVDVSKICLVGKCFKKIAPELSTEFYQNFWKGRELDSKFPELSEATVIHIFDAWLHILFSCSCAHTPQDKYTDTLWSFGELYASNRMAPLIISKGIKFMKIKTQEFLDNPDSALPYHTRLELVTSTFKAIDMNQSVLNHCIIV